MCKTLGPLSVAYDTNLDPSEQSLLCLAIVAGLALIILIIIKSE